MKNICDQNEPKKTALVQYHPALRRRSMSPKRNEHRATSQGVVALIKSLCLGLSVNTLVLLLDLILSLIVQLRVQFSGKLYLLPRLAVKDLRPIPCCWSALTAACVFLVLGCHSRLFRTTVHFTGRVVGLSSESGLYNPP